MASCAPVGRVGLSLAFLGLLAACGTTAARRLPAGSRQASVGHYKVGQPYQVNGRWYRPEYDPSYVRVGTASWYGADFHGLPTANGEVFDKEQLTAAHPTLPLPSIVRVTNLENGRSLEVRVNDRGPFVGDRLIDLSQAAARKLGYESRAWRRCGSSSWASPTPTAPPPVPTVVQRGTTLRQLAAGADAPIAARGAEARRPGRSRGPGRRACPAPQLPPSLRRRPAAGPDRRLRRDRSGADRDGRPSRAWSRCRSSRPSPARARWPGCGSGRSADPAAADRLLGRRWRWATPTPSWFPRRARAVSTLASC